jgi:uncharacterized protein
MIESRYEHLRSLLRGYGSCVVAYSGGVDSVFLARVAHDVLGDRSLAAIADSPSLPRRELREAVEIAERFGIPLRVVHTAEFQNDRYLANPTDRCYFCKHALFSELEPLTRSLGFRVMAYGENASDVGDHRPGARAAGEFEVRAPLKEAGLTKPEIRELSARLGLPTADKPQLACLSSRIPTGEPVTPEKLRMVEDAEYLLRDLGFHDVRVRHHELGGALRGHLARVEVGHGEFPLLLESQVRDRITDGFRAVGYTQVTLDLAGYRRGSNNGVAPAAPIRFQAPNTATGR